ncbi:hypothetical protein FEI13_16715 [Halomonas urmiana]|uniref:Uncharacterized protein n=1 Tax=Halomonas urmiana TaxID=490901 RepID=A0A5R8M980_9GAMM|nr:hypothetical protein [Halomonas urmiana]TLF46133.1 hypothetical protein FEI13_16715 [Halomonas urmiana]
MTSGITFEETMRGGFTLGETDPQAGAAAGRRAGTRLALHARIAIDDLEAFVADPQHAGRIAGCIDFPPLGMGLEAPDGVFQLFAPAQQGGAQRRMVYELGFTLEGQPHYLAGEKRVHDDVGPDLWRDTTTLYTRLHRGEDADGEVVGAGILELGVPQLMALLSTLTVTGDGGTRTLATFGSFFFGELWDLYAPLVPGGRP